MCAVRVRQTAQILNRTGLVRYAARVGRLRAPPIRRPGSIVADKACTGPRRSPSATAAATAPCSRSFRVHFNREGLARLVATRQTVSDPQPRYRVDEIRTWRDAIDGVLPVRIRYAVYGWPLHVSSGLLPESQGNRVNEGRRPYHGTSLGLSCLDTVPDTLVVTGSSSNCTSTSAIWPAVTEMPVSSFACIGRGHDDLVD